MPKPGQMKSNVLLLGGVVGVLGGLALLAYGLAPAKDLWEAVGPAFSGGTPPEDLSERLDAAMAGLKGRAFIDAFGVLALMAGIVLVKQAFAKPKEKPVEQLVKEEVERRLAAPEPVAHGTQALPLPAAPPAPAARATSVAGARPTAVQGTASMQGSQPAARLVPPVRRTHCVACGSVLVAGGRICPSGHPQA